MYLKKLEVKGFKSFASATTFELEPGITCVVGPNGSGKSNVVDALAWVMGEQGAKSLRGGKMEDVIFAGTAGRAALGRAQVSLTIDNTDGALPIDYTEVTVSRTMFRSGGSEYAINGDSARLLDIQELLSDSGIGKEMHVIVGQNQLDAVLRATPEERRGFIEEAAGILKHRRRKEKALRKLDSIAEGLARLTDLTTEVRRQLGPLGRQAEIAKQAQSIQIAVRDSGLRLLADDVARAQSLNERSRDIESQLAAKRRDIETQLDAAETALAHSQERSTRDAAEAKRVALLVRRLDAVVGKLSNTVQLASERARNLEEQPLAAAGAQSPQDLDASAERASAEADAQEALLADHEKDAATLTTQLDEARTRVEQEDARVTAARVAVASYREKSAALAAAHQHAVSAHDSAIRERQRGHATLTAAVERATAAEAELATLEHSEHPSDEPTQDHAATYQHACDTRDDADSARAQARADLQTATREHATFTARYDALTMATRAATQGTAAILDAPTLPTRGRLSHLITATPGDEDTLAAALGNAADAIVVDTFDDAREVLAYCQENNLGDVPLVVTEALTLPATDRPALLDTERAAHHLVLGDDDVARAARALVASIAVVDNDDAAREVVRRTEGAWQAVTTRGNTWGPHRVDHAGSSADSALSLEASAAEAKTRASEANERIEVARSALATAEGHYTACRAAVDEALQRLRADDSAKAAATEAKSRLRAAARSARGEASRLGESLERLEQAESEHHARLVAAEQAQQHFANTPAPNAPDTSALDDARAEVERLRLRETQVLLAAQSTREAVAHHRSRATSLRHAADKERRALEHAKQRAAKRAERAARIRRVHAAAEHALTVARHDAATGAEYEKTVEATHQQSVADAARHANEAAELREQRDTLLSTTHQEELARAEREVILRSLEDRCDTEYSMTASDVVEEFGPHRDVPTITADGDEHYTPYVRAEQEKRYKKATRDLKKLGKVNPLALEEFAALQERYEFLQAQINDLDTSRKDLLTLIKQIDDRVLQVFSEAYRDVEREFVGVFATLFPGGDGKLSLTDPSDMLTTGIDVEARPAGKKVKRLSLLSGGERSLTAVALLVAIFKARPSPFYVLDEVEAALDDANLGRLLSVLTQLRETSQLIVITHQKRTMEVADALYGVSMRGDGVTKVVSQKMSRDEDTTVDLRDAPGERHIALRDSPVSSGDS